MIRSFTSIILLALAMPLAADAQKSATTQVPSVPKPSQSVVPATPKDDETSTPTSQGRRVIERIKSGLDSKGLASNALSVLDELLDDTRSAQARVYNAARNINRNLAELDPSDARTVSQARTLTRKLLSASYGDSLFQSGNLSDQIVTRLSNLIADSLLLQTDKSEQLRQDFIEELRILTERFEDSRRFRAGLGAEYIYMPKVTYAGAASIDLSPFQLPGLDAGGTTGFVLGFNSQAAAATRLVVAGSGLSVSFSIPTKSQTRQITTSVRQARASSSASSPDLLYRTTFTSDLKPEFDASISVSLIYAYDAFKRKPQERRGRDRLSYHLGIGMTGFQIDESATTEIRVRNDPTQSFDSLTRSGITSASRRLSFKSAYWNADVRFEVSDESQLGVSYRQYFGNRSNDETKPRVSGYALGIYFVWMPTFGW